ncbi:undecaprenyl-phosphate glucose phosphotransferase [Paenibacillus thalictri]|uniref:Undecaprenyl-phosphate glucose phosphotransferase n=1 Tax=Paenibacillus thalictri TaxID=2527873 RepID=A0A4V6MSB8_9BACL|nr:undecaprenyl-phosphate glucose phosphotransferase [Paenibacillus thalictri]TBL67770.1 undecaprenyl-phosphate glucose phosphotransferase [Paenibacillus thalictri]
MIRGKERFFSQAYILIDFFIIQIMALFSWWIKFESELVSYELNLPLERYYLWSIIYGAIAAFIGYTGSLYSSKRNKSFSYELIRIIQVHFISLLLLLSLLFIFREVNLSRTYLIFYLINNIMFIGLYRYCIKVVLRIFREKGYNKKFILIIGAGKLGQKFHDNITLHPELGYEVVGYIDDFHSTPINNKLILGTTNSLEEVLNKVFIDEVIIALPLTAHEKYLSIINICEKVGVKTLIIPDFFNLLPAKPYFDNFAGIPIINVRDIPLDELSNRLFKRMFDIVFSLCAIFLVLPLMIAIAVGVKLTSPGPIIFKQERVGLNRRNFYMYKFRSMRVMPPGFIDTGWTTLNDPRKTRFGAFLRKTSLDELPQFFNVLFGHMSVVGPRPERPYFVEQFKEEIPKYMIKHHIRPGITGWAQSNGLRGDTSIEDRIKHDIFYIENWSFLFDIKIIFKTIVNGFINKNAY